MPSPDSLNVKHHTFLQALMSRGPLLEETVHGIYRALLRINSLDGFNTFIGEINKELEFVEMELKKATNQHDRKEYYGMVNKLASSQAKLGTKYSNAQIAFFKAVMEAIVLDSSGSGYIQSSRAINLRPSEAIQIAPSQAGVSQAVPIKMTLTAKEEALVLLVKDQWLSRTDDGGVSLGTRAFLELRGVFRNLEVPFCEVCNEAAIKAELCQNQECLVRIHSYCLTKKFRARQGRVCSRCHTEWKCAVPERDDEDQEDSQRPVQGKDSSRRPTVRERVAPPSRKSQISRAKAERLASSSSEEQRDTAEEDDSGNDEEITRLVSDEEPEASPQAVTTRKRRLRRRD